VKRAVMGPVANYLRLWDYASAARVDEFVANSENVKRRVWKTYRREAEVVYPPVAVDGFRCERAEDYYLIVSELVPYKRVDLAVRTFSKSGRRLKIAGDGPEFKRLRKGAARNIEFCGRVTDEELRGLYARCRAFVMAGEEDFGITAVEAIASGRAVIALGRGGVLEIVPEEGRFLFDSADEEAMEGAIRRFEAAENNLPVELIRGAARKFSEEEFDRKMRLVLYRE
jgi:glycosyltransferase involved in cell wall biosynthesis